METVIVQERVKKTELLQQMHNYKLEIMTEFKVELGYYETDQGVKYVSMVLAFVTPCASYLTGQRLLSLNINLAINHHSIHSMLSRGLCSRDFYAFTFRLDM